MECTKRRTEVKTRCCNKVSCRFKWREGDQNPPRKVRMRAQGRCQQRRSQVPRGTGNSSCRHSRWLRRQGAWSAESREDRHNLRISLSITVSSEFVDLSVELLCDTVRASHVPDVDRVCQRWRFSMKLNDLEEVAVAVAGNLMEPRKWPDIVLTLFQRWRRTTYGVAGSLIEPKGELP